MVISGSSIILRADKIFNCKPQSVFSNSEEERSKVNHAGEFVNTTEKGRGKNKTEQNCSIRRHYYNSQHFCSHSESNKIKKNKKKILN